jgi:hypothetical protein
MTTVIGKVRNLGIICTNSDKHFSGDVSVNLGADLAQAFEDDESDRSFSFQTDGYISVYVGSKEFLRLLEIIGDRESFQIANQYRDLELELVSTSRTCTLK